MYIYVRRTYCYWTANIFALVILQRLNIYIINVYNILTNLRKYFMLEIIKFIQFFHRIYVNIIKI
jgi:hypothetical protein